MDLTLTIGWWIVPLILTAIFYLIAVSKFSYGGGDYSFPEVGNALLLLVATVPSLVVWLLWALIAP